MIPKAAIDIIVDLWPILFLCIITTICLKVAYSLANCTKLELYKEMINLVFIAYVNYYCKSKNIAYSLLITLIVSTTIETIQLTLGRSFDIDDIILNVLGGVVGYLLYIFSEFIFKKTSEKVKNSFLLNLICVLIIIILLVIILSLYGVVI